MPKRQLCITSLSALLCLGLITPSVGLAQQGPAAGPAREEMHGILAALQDSARYVRLFALDRVGGTRLTTAIPQVMRLLNAPDPQVQSAAAEALARIGTLDERYRRPLLQLLDPSQPATFAAAARVLGAAGWLPRQHAAALAELLEVRQGPYVEIRTNAAYALGSLGPAASEYHPDLAFLARRAYQSFDLNPTYRRQQSIAALHALGELGGAGVPPLLDLMVSPEADSIGFTYCEHIGRALSRTGVSDTTLLPALLTQIARKEVRAMCALGVLSVHHVGAKRYQDAIYENLGPRADSIRDGLLIRVFHRDDFNYLERALSGLAPGAIRSAAPFIAAENPDLLRAHVPELMQLLRHHTRDVIAAGGYLLAATDALPMGGGTRMLEIAFDPSVSDDAQLLALRAVQHLETSRLKIEAEPFKDELFQLALGLHALEHFRCRPWNPELKFQIVGLPENAPTAAGVVARLAPLDTRRVIEFLKSVYPDSSAPAGVCYDEEYAGMVRFYAYLMAGGDSANLLLVRHWGRSANTWRNQPQRSAVLALIRNILQAWEDPGTPDPMRAEAAPLLASIARELEMERGDRVLIDSVESKLRKGGFLDEADAVRARLTRGTVETTLGLARRSAAGYAVLWLLILLAYPRSRWVQTNVVWHPQVRKWLGLGVPGFLITSIPFLRRWILRPFTTDLRSGALHPAPAGEPYFPEVSVIDASGNVAPILEVLTDVRGRVVLQGKSGLGKTVFLRELVTRASGPIVYLEARSCGGGVVEAISRYIPGGLGDRDFLERLVHCGGLDVCIDGLNETSVEVRMKVHQFFESARRANVLITTQPLEWSPPPDVRHFELQPLGSTEIHKFLLHQGRNTGISDPLGYTVYEVACNRYLDGLKANGHDPALWEEMQAVLSNPMDLTVVAQLLARGVWPDLLKLQRQQYDLMERTYSERNGGAPFPLSRFSSAVYEGRAAGNFRVPDGFPEEVLALGEHRMITGRQTLPESGNQRWVHYFRHEKIADFFIAENFAGDGREKLFDHTQEPRFRGVYLLLAARLAPEQSAELKEVLVEYAAQTGDHTLSDAYVLRHRAIAQLALANDVWRTEQGARGD